MEKQIIRIATRLALQQGLPQLAKNMDTFVLFVKRLLPPGGKLNVRTIMYWGSRVTFSDCRTTTTDIVVQPRTPPDPNLLMLLFKPIQVSELPD